LLSVGLLVFDHFERANVLAVGLAAASLVAVLVRLVLFFRDNVRMLRKSLSEATTDLLTGLPNRRKLMADLERKLPQASEDDPLALILLDLDGFKLYNDNFGHPAGDELLVRLGRRLASACGQSAVPYRMGGDEFCVLSNVEGRSAYDLASSAAQALDEEGEGFRVSASYGTVLMPNETADVGEALRLVDARMYVQKQSGRASASHQSTNVLLQAIMECERELGLHLNAVTELAEATGRRMELPEDELERARLTASLHDVGKVAIPDAILAKAEPLDETEWQFIQRHTLIGQRILAAAPALVDVAQLVRWTHERFDGRGYPDGLEGESIPLALRIVAVCDAFEAMISKRTYREAMSVGDALAELRRCSGTQFDPAVVEALCGEVAARGKRARPLVGISASSRR
jgi:two-component system cell cycle response regulator